MPEPDTQAGSPRRASRQARRMYARRRRVAFLGALALVAVVVAGAAVALSGGEKEPRAKRPEPTTTTTSTTVPAPGVETFTVATTKGQDVAVYEQPDASAP